MIQSDFEELLTGMWQNPTSNYLWSFHPLSDGQRNAIVVDDNRPVGGRSFWYEVAIKDDNIFIDLIIGGVRSQHKIILLSERIIKFFDPPFDNAENAPDVSIVLNKVAP